MSTIIKYAKGDRLIWVIIIVLSFISLSAVYSTSGSLAEINEKSIWYYVFKHLGVQLTSFVVILFMINFLPVRLYSQIAGIGLLIAIVFMVMGLVLRDSASSGRTLRFGVVSFQPAEFAKVALVMWVAKFLGRGQSSKSKLREAFWYIVIPTVLICGIILFSDFSTSVLLFMAVLIMMFVGMISWKYMSVLVLSIFVPVLLVCVFYTSLPEVGRFQTVRGRIERFVNGNGPENSQEGYAIAAVHRSGYTGQGPGGGLLSTIISAPYDFIYAVIIEEYGPVLGAFILFLYLVILFRGGVVIKYCSRTFPAFLVVGSVSIIVLQAMFHMGVSANLLPVTGQPLPWVSWGGTSQIFTAVLLGMLLSVSYQNSRARRREVESSFSYEPESLPDDVSLREEMA